MHENTLRKGYRNAWILTLLATAFVVGFFLFVLRTNRPAWPETWDMGGTPFVPASNVAAEGYDQGERK